MTRVGIYEQIKTAFQDLVAPAIHELRGDIRVLDERVSALDAKLELKVATLDTKFTERIDALDAKFDHKITMIEIKVDSFRAEAVSMKNELVSEIRRVDTRIDGLERELRLTLDIRDRLTALEARRS
jgi:polyhydroxyalkanoate synthesis regulator phasin